jgi:hypothetical protein
VYGYFPVTVFAIFKLKSAIASLAKAFDFHFRAFSDAVRIPQSGYDDEPNDGKHDNCYNF